MSPAAAPASAAGSTTAAPSSTVCVFDVRGVPGSSKINSAQLSCTGSAIITLSSELKLINANFTGFVPRYYDPLPNPSTRTGLIAVEAFTALTITNSTFTDISTGLDSVLYIASGSTVTLSSTLFKNNQASKAGSLFVNTPVSSVAIQNCTFDNNTGTSNTSSAGGVLVLAGDGQPTQMSVDGSVFNRQTSASAGGLYLYKVGNLTVSNSQFTNNVGQKFAGGLFVEAGCPGTYGCVSRVTRSTFFNNSAGVAGGGAIWTQLPGWVSIYDFCYFASNSGAEQGGALVVHRRQSLQISDLAASGTGTLTILNNTNFQDNYALGRTNPSDPQYNGRGGAVSLENVMCVAILNCTFQNNVANAGGAVYVKGLHGDAFTCAHVADSYQLVASSAAAPLFDPRSASPYEHFDRYTKTISADWRKSSFTGNVARIRDGGALLLLSSDNIHFSNLTFSGNTANSTGGAVTAFSAGSGTIFADCAFDSNTAAGQAGGLYFSSVDTTSGLQLQHVMFTNNYAVGGGALYGAANSNISLAYGTQLASNSAGFLGGGAISCRECYSLEVRDSMISNNTVSNDIGGAIKLLDVSICSLHNSQFSNNRAAAGGAVSVETGAAYGTTLLIINASRFDGNHAVSTTAAGSYTDLMGMGGAVRMFGAVLVSTDSSFDSNTASSIGGAIYVNQSCLPLGQDLVTFWEDFPDGRALAKLSSTKQAAQCSLFVASNTSMTNNRAEGAGGALFAISPSTLVLPCDKTPGLSGIQLYEALQSTSLAVRQLSDICPAWTAPSANNTVGSNGYGPVVAFPGTSVTAFCVNSASNAYNCGVGQAAGVNVSASSLGRSTLETGGGGPGALQVSTFWSTSLTDPATGQAISRLRLNATLMDPFGQYVTQDWPMGGPVRVQAGMDNATSGIIYGQLIVDANETGGVASFDNLVMRAAAGDHSMYITVPTIQGVIRQNVSVGVRQCYVGEVVGTSQNTCDRCPSGQWTLSNNNSTCQGQCPANANCTGGGVLFPQLGYWHSSPEASLMHRCPNEAACRGNRTYLEVWQTETYATVTVSRAAGADDAYMAKQCSPGYKGNLCGQCDDGYGTSGRFKCSKCASRQVVIVAWVVIGCVMLAFIAVKLAFTLRDQLSDWQHSQASDYMQVAMIYFQIMALIRILDIAWPGAMGKLFTAAEWLTATSNFSGVSLDCLFQQSTALPIAAKSTLVHISIPLIVLALGYALWMAHGALRSANKSRLCNQLQVTVYTVMGFYYPSLAQTILALFACYPIENHIPATQLYPSYLRATAPYGYWIQDVGTVCYANWHRGFSLGLGIPALLIFPVGIPAVHILLLWTKRRQLGHECTKLRYGYLYRPFRDGFWWEGARMQLFLLAVTVCVVNARPLGTYMQTLILLSLLTAELVYQAVCQPFKKGWVQVLSGATIAMLVFTAQALLYLANYEGLADADGLFSVAVMACVGNAALLGLLLAVAGYKMLAGFRERRRARDRDLPARANIVESKEGVVSPPGVKYGDMDQADEQRMYINSAYDSACDPAATKL